MRTKILGLLAVALLSGPMTANAALISTSIGEFNVATVTCTINDSTCLDILDGQVWWLNPGLANGFVNLVGLQLGTPNCAF